MLLFGSPRPPFRFQRNFFSATDQIVDLQCFAGDRGDGLSGFFRNLQPTSAHVATGGVRPCSILFDSVRFL